MKLSQASFFAVLVLMMNGCLPMNRSNSTSQDALVYGAVAPTAATGGSAQNQQLYTSAQTIIQKNCVTCHANYSNQSQAQWIAADYIVPGSPETSELFGHLKGSDVGGAEDMPQGGQLAAADIQTIREWIVSISATSSGTTVGPNGTAASRSTAALQVFAVACASCHNVTTTATSTSYSGTTIPAWGTFTTDQQFVQSGMISPEFPDDSWLYRSLKVHGDINTQPQGASALTDAQALTIYNWILDIDNP
jgi:mono/diheme cytochrome c family protein